MFCMLKFKSMKSSRSDKPLSTDWLGNLLSLLYKTLAGNSEIFDSVIVVTNKRVLSKQIRKSIKQMKKAKGKINPVRVTPEQIETVLRTEKSIIITTMRKFPVVLESIVQMKNRKFAVIISETHASPSIDTSRHLKNLLLKSVAKERLISEGKENSRTPGLSSTVETDLAKEQTHICYFGFSGSPGNETLKLFEGRSEEGTFEPYDFISMKQKYTGRIYVGCSSILAYL